MPSVVFFPAEVAGAIKIPTNMISLNSPNDWQKFEVQHKRLLVLNFYPNDYLYMSKDGPTEETAQKIIDFVISCNGEPIVVHCGEGRIRSAAVAAFMERDMGYTIEDARGSLNSTAGMSKHLYRLLRRQYDPIKKMQRRIDELVDSGCEIVDVNHTTGVIQHIPRHLSKDRFPGMHFYPKDSTGMDELSFEERVLLLNGGFSIVQIPDRKSVV